MEVPGTMFCYLIQGNYTKYGVELISVETSQFTGKENISLLKRPYKLENNEMKVHLVLVVIFIAQSSGKPVNEVTSAKYYLI